jgi:hypothetical protein
MKILFLSAFVVSGKTHYEFGIYSSNVVSTIQGHIINSFGDFGLFGYTCCLCWQLYNWFGIEQEKFQARKRNKMVGSGICRLLLLFLVLHGVSCRVVQQQTDAQKPACSGLKAEGIGDGRSPKDSCREKVNMSIIPKG